MELEALRKQLTEEIAGEFDSKLRELKRQKSHIEEEFEVSSEKWRTERRRLNSEIDRLEAALAESRQSGRDSMDTRNDPSVDPQEILKLQTAAEERIKESEQAWEVERTRLQSEVSRLQESIAELIERNNNPLRANPIERSKLESKYEDAVRSKRLAEEALVKAKGEWEAEKLTLIADSKKVRPAATPSAAIAARKADEQLEKKLQDATRLQETLVSDLEKARQELSRLKDAHAAELQSLTARLQSAKTEWEAEKRALVDQIAQLRENPSAAPATIDDQLEKQMKEAVRLRDGLASDLEKTRIELSTLQKAHIAENQNMAARLQAAKSEWESEKAALVNEVSKLRQAPPAPPASAPAKIDDQLEKQMKEAFRLRDGLASDLEKTRSELSTLQKAHAAENQNMAARLQATKSEWESEKAALVSEVTKLRQAPPAPPASAPRKFDDQLDKRLQEAIKVRDGLTSDLEKAKNEMARLKETHSSELKDFTSRYIQTRTDLERQLKESEETKSRLERELEKAQKASAQNTNSGSEEAARLKKELDGATKEIAALNARLAQSKDAAGADGIANLQRQFDARIQEMMQENSRLTEKIRNAAAQPAAGGNAAPPGGSGSNGSPAVTLDGSSIDEELKRVEALTAEIAKLIDDPETELATVIRKNVERAALESYAKGILFSLGRGKRI